MRSYSSASAAATWPSLFRSNRDTRHETGLLLRRQRAIASLVSRQFATVSPCRCQCATNRSESARPPRKASATTPSMGPAIHSCAHAASTGIDFRRSHLPRCSLVPIHECQVTRQRCIEKGRRISQAAWGRIEAIRDSPTDRPVADDEVPAFGWAQREPVEMWKPPNLKVVGVNVNQFQEVRCFECVRNPPVIKKTVGILSLDLVVIAKDLVNQPNLPFARLKFRQCRRRRFDHRATRRGKYRVAQSPLRRCIGKDRDAAQARYRMTSGSSWSIDVL